MLVRRLLRGARLTALMDCCRSGTGMDLPYGYDEYSGGWGRLADGGRVGGGSGDGGVMGLVGKLGK